MSISCDPLLEPVLRNRGEDPWDCARLEQVRQIGGLGGIPQEGPHMEEQLLGYVVLEKAREGDGCAK